MIGYGSLMTFAGFRTIVTWPLTPIWVYIGLHRCR